MWRGETLRREKLRNGVSKWIRRWVYEGSEREKNEMREWIRRWIGGEKKE